MHSPDSDLSRRDKTGFISPITPNSVNAGLWHSVSSEKKTEEHPQQIDILAVKDEYIALAERLQQNETVLETEMDAYEQRYEAALISLDDDSTRDTFKKWCPINFLKDFFLLRQAAISSSDTSEKSSASEYELGLSCELYMSPLIQGIMNKINESILLFGGQALSRQARYDYAFGINTIYYSLDSVLDSARVDLTQTFEALSLNETGELSRHEMFSTALETEKASAEANNQQTALIDLILNIICKNIPFELSTEQRQQVQNDMNALFEQQQLVEDFSMETYDTESTYRFSFGSGASSPVARSIVTTETSLERTTLSFP